MSLSNLAFGDSTKKNVDTLNKLINTTNVTGENLLINPNFKLNSWGETTYKAEKTGRIFSVDSWLFVVNNVGSMLDVTDNGIRITNASDTSTAPIVQEISSENILGNKITISVKLGSFTTPESGDAPGFIDFHKKEGGVSAGISSYFTGAQQNEVFTISFDIPSDVDIRYICFGACTGCTIEIEWVKMELGEFSTNFIEPDPRNELEKVNQYYYRNPLIGNETKDIVLKDILTNPKYPYPYNVRINSSTAPEGDTSGLYIPDIGLHGATTDDIWWDIHYYPDNINKTNSTLIAYSGEGVRIKNGDGEWISVDNARSSDVSYFQQEHILTDGTDILAYVTSDECPIGRNTKVRILNCPTCPTNYGYIGTDNDFFYDIYKLFDKKWATVKAYDIRANFEYMNSLVNGNWNGWTRCNDYGNASNAQSLNGFTVSNSGLDLIGNPTASGSKPVLGIFDNTNGSYAFYDIRQSNGDIGRLQITAYNAADVLLQVYKHVAETDTWTEGLVNKAASANLSHHQSEHFLADGTDVLSYIVSDICPAPFSTVVRIMHSPTCPTNYGYSASDNDFFYHIFKLNNSWSTVKAYDIRGNVEFINSCLNGTWSGWIKCNGVGKNTAGQTYTYNGISYSGSINCEVFNDGCSAGGNYCHAEGKNTAAYVYASHAEGCNTTASGSGAHAEGYGTTASGSQSHAEGYKTTAYGSASHAEGSNSDSSGTAMSDRTVTVGSTSITVIGSQSYGINSHAEGTQTLAYGYTSHAEGYQTTASGSDSHAEGRETTASGSCDHAEGYRTTASGNDSHAEGNRTTASRGQAHAEGYGTTASSGQAHAEGHSTTASADQSHAEGYGTKASSGQAHAEGNSTTASGDKSHAEGFGTTASGNDSHAEGKNTEASADQSHAEGQKTTASANQSHAEGYGTTASGAASHAEGDKTTASGKASHAEGSNSDSSGTALSDRTVTVGSTSITVVGSQSYGINSHAEGTQTLAYGYTSHAEGYQTTASAEGAHAEGRKTTASSGQSHAEGYGTSASGSDSHAEGRNTTASGNKSHTEGYLTTASGNNSHAEGCGTIASSFASHAGGKNNKAMTNCKSESTTTGDAFVIGNGTSNSALSNAFRVTYAGYVYGLSSFKSSGADYAEFIKPWFDNNPDNEDRVGYFVTIKDGLLYKANEGDYITGITSGNPSVVGNADEDYYWRYERDEFNRFVYEDVEEEIEKLDDDGNPILDDDGHPVMIKTGNIIKNGRLKLSEDYDPSKQNSYVERKDRPEWSYVGMIGVLPVRDDGTCEVGRFCKCGKDGIATLATERGFDTFFVIERISDNIVIVELR